MISDMIVDMAVAQYAQRGSHDKVCLVSAKDFASLQEEISGKYVTSTVQGLLQIYGPSGPIEIRKDAFVPEGTCFLIADYYLPKGYVPPSPPKSELVADFFLGELP